MGAFCTYVTILKKFAKLRLVTKGNMVKKIKTDIMDLAKQIDSEISAREVSLDQKEASLQEEKNLLASEKTQLEMDRDSFLKEKADFKRISSEVEQKFAKIRSDEKLSQDLQTQAIQSKEMEEVLKSTKEERGLTEHNLRQIEKREIAVTEREKNYKEEISKEFANKFLKV